MKLTLEKKHIVRLSLTEKQLKTILAALDLASDQATNTAYQDVPPIHRYLTLLYQRALKARDLILS